MQLHVMYIMPLISPPSQDVKAQISIPLLGYEVKEVPQSDTRHIFQMVQSKQVYTLVAEDEELKQRWMKVIAQAACGQEEEDSDE